MIFLNTGLVVKSSTKVDYKLPKTSSIIVINENFCTNDNFIYTYDKDSIISTFSTVPFNRIKTLQYKKPIIDILSTNVSLFLLNNDSLTAYGKEIFNVYSDIFNDSKLVNMGPDYSVGIQKLNELQLFDENLHRVKSITCQSSYYGGRIMTSDMNILTIHGDKPIKICLPDIITCIQQAGQKIFCGSIDSNIYCIDQNENRVTILEYHFNKIKQLQVSICGSHLYSLDSEKICIWDVDHEVVMGFIEDSFEKMEVIQLNDIIYKLELNHIN